MASPMSSPKAKSIPPDAKIISALQRTVRAIFDSGDLESLTLRRVRADTEQELGLEADFFKTDRRWKEKSKTTVNDEVNRCDASQVEREDAEDKPATEQAKVTKTPNSHPPKKRKSEEPIAQQEPKKKRQKNDTRADPAHESSSPLSSALSASAGEDEYKEDDGASQAKTSAKAAKTGQADDSSELSEVLDEPPAPKKRRKGSSVGREPSSKKKESKKKKSTTTGKGDANLSPQEEEIKRLQSQLVKCGIRKVWSRELARYDSTRDKISHLKRMLQDAGLEGRFSEEKARQIREKRELEAELEAVQAYSKAWGKAKDGGDDDNDDDDDDAGNDKREDERPAGRRVLAKGLQELQALADDEEEDSD